MPTIIHIFAARTSYFYNLSGKLFTVSGSIKLFSRKRMNPIKKAPITSEVEMAHTEIESFQPDVVAKLKTYVYRLIDPRNGETFYVGKGKGNRVFAHIHEELGREGDGLNDKIKRIREIRCAGFEVAHVIHRHGMDDKTAFEVESQNGGWLDLRYPSVACFSRVFLRCVRP